MKPLKYILRIKQSLFCVERVLSVNSERLIMQMADRLAEDGYRDAGYIYVSIDVSCIRDGSRNLCCGFYSLKYDTSQRRFSEYMLLFWR